MKPHATSPQHPGRPALRFAALGLLAVALAAAKPPQEIIVPSKAVKGKSMNTQAAAGQGVATFAGGCFWCIEAAFLDVEGVSAAVSGYANGHDPAPTYEKVGTGKTGHVAAVQVTYDTTTVSDEL